MSGFAGIIRFDDGPVARGDLLRLAAGLDATSMGQPSFWQDGCAGLVYRARITTPEDRHDRQPRPLCGDHAFLVFDGRLDNRATLLDRLALDPALPRADSALVAAAFERWGAALAPELLGDFVLACWDSRARRLLLARDHVGQRNLYYYRTPHFLAFATTLRALLTLPQIPRALDEVALANLLLVNPFDAQATIYADIRRLPAAHSLHATPDGEIRLQQYWSLDDARRVRFACDDDYIEAGRELLDQAVACRLRLVGPIVTLTSGGLDSAGVTATAARLSFPQPVLGLTAVPPSGFAESPIAGRYPDERPYVRALGESYPNLEIETISPDRAEMIEEDAARLFAVAAQPFRNVTNVAWFAPLDRRAAELGAHVMLCGSLGNMGLSYDGLGRFDELLWQGRWITLARELLRTGRFLDIAPARLLVRQLRTTRGPLTWRHLLRRFRFRGRDQDASAAWRDYSALDSGFARRADLALRLSRSQFDPARRWTRGTYRATLPRLLEAFDHLADGRAAQRALTGIEFRDPLADIRLLEFCYALPARQFLRDGRTRALARNVLADRLPPIILDNPRRGAQCPEWFDRLDRRHAGIAAEIEKLTSSAMASRLLDIPRLRRLADQWPANGEEAANQVDAYRFLLTRGLHVGQFIRWFEGAND